MKHLRVYLKQPSPSWVDYTIREVQLYMKKTNSKTMSIYENNESESKQSNPFDSFKSQIKRNIKNMKKDQESAQSFQSNFNTDNMGSGMNQEEIAAMAKYHWTEEVPSYLYHEDVRKADLYYNVL